MIKNKAKKLAVIPTVAFVTFASAVSAGGGGNPSVSLEQTVGTVLGDCAVSNFVTINLGEQVDFCYTITNDGDEPFDLHSLSTSGFGDVLSGVPQLLAPGVTLSINDVRTLSSDVLNEATWLAVQSPVDPPLVSVSNDPGAFVDISGTGTPLNAGDDGAVNVSLPFSFNYYGVDSTDLRVGGNGAMLFGVTTGDIDFEDLPLPTTGADAQPLIAPFWSDLFDSFPNANQFFEVVGVAPNREALVQWEQVTDWNGVETENVTFQVALIEGTNEIQFRYEDVVFGGSAAALDGGAGASIGIDSGDGTNAVQFSFEGSTLVNDGDVVSFLPAPVTIFAEDTSSAAVAVLVPQVDVSPSSIDTGIDSGGMGSEVINIANVGQGLLDWSVNEADAPSPLKFPVNTYMPEIQANQSMLASPIVRVPSAKPSNPVNVLGGLAGSSAFGVDLITDQLFETSVGSPNDSNIVSGGVTQNLFGGDFIDGDFTQLVGFDFDNATDDGDDAEDNLVLISTSDGTVTTVGPLNVQTDPVNENFAGLTQDPTTGTVYAVAFDANGGLTNLYTVDVGTATTTFVAALTNVVLAIDVAVSATGQMYVHDITSDSIIAIDKVTGEGTVIGATGFDANFAQGMAFDLSTNTLYLAAFNNGPAQDYELREVDLETGATTLLGSIAGQNEVGAFGFAEPIEACYLDEDLAWLSLDTTSGSVGGGDSDPVTVNFDAAGLADGIYSANVCVFSNDPSESLIKVPVTLQVGPDDLIFANGFEAPQPPPPPAN